MRWVDIAGPPGVGKSTLCDAAWPPRGIAPDRRGYPAAWGEFLAVVERLLGLVAGHRSIAACRSMTARSFAKMATVSRRADRRVYVQTGFAQRGLGLGWRLVDLGRPLAPLADYYRLMPVSLGVTLLSAPVATVQARNVARGKDRAFMVPLMAGPLAIAAEVLAARAVPLLELDMTRPIDDNARLLDAFAAARAGHGAAGAGAAGPGGEGALLPAPG